MNTLELNELEFADGWYYGSGDTIIGRYTDDNWDYLVVHRPLSLGYAEIIVLREQYDVWHVVRSMTI